MALAASPLAAAVAQSDPRPEVIYLNAGEIDTAAAPAVARRSAVSSAAGRQLHLVQFDGPVQPGWKDQLEQAGLEVVDYIPENTYLVYGDAAAIRNMQVRPAAKDHVRWDGSYRGADKIHPVAAAAAKASASRPDPNMFSIQLVLDPDANPATLALIDSLKLGPILRQGATGKYYNLVVRLPQGKLAQVSDQPDVISILPYNVPKMRDERQSVIMSGQLSGNAPTGPGYMAWLAAKGFTQAQFDASGLVVDVTDSPIDNGTTNANHFALYANGTITNSTSRVVYSRLEGTANTGSVTVAADGHGNLNAHIIAGQVNLTNSPHADSAGYRYGLGVAPFVRVGGSIIFDTSSFTSPSYDNLAARAYRDGARISGNSWGADTAGAYDADAQNYDRLVRDAQPAGSAVAATGNQEMTFVFAAGNAGPSTQTVGSPGTAKNVITVGAGENVRAFGGSDGSAVADTGADSANDVIDFSSRGPCSDLRKKPDIMAPGTHITGGAPQAAKVMTGTGTALAAFAADGSGVSGGITNSIYFPSSGQQFYTASSGTSHSTPAVAGAAALVYQSFLNQGRPAPSPAMVKGYLMNASRYMTGLYANDTLYSNVQGMGAVDLGATFDATPRFLRDQQTADIFTASGQSRTWTGTIVASDKPVRVTLAWTDAPGSTTGNAYKNNLDLRVVVNGQTYFGNNFSGAASVTGGAADARNNVESVFLPAGTTGSVTVTVSGTNINSDGVPNYGTTIDQDFALVAYNFTEVLAPSISLTGAQLVAEGNAPTNGAIDPGETVTVAFALQNSGSLATTNLVATLLATNGIAPVPPESRTYGTLVAAGAPATNTFQFVASGTLGATATAVLALQDGTNDLGTVPYTFLLGPPPPVVLSEDFASITAGNSTSTGGSTTAWSGNTNFPTASAAYQAGGAVRLGTSASVGSITSRALDLSPNAGNFSVSFDVKGWTTVEGQIKVTAAGSSQTVPYTAVMASGSFDRKTLNFSGGTNGSTVKIETTAKRAFIDNVVVTTASAPSAQPVITSSLTASGTVGSAFSYQIAASGSPTSYGATNLPAGLSVDAATGAITGTPAAAGTNNATISASNANGTGSATLVITVAAAPAAPVITSATSVSGAVGVPFSYQIAASGSPTSFGATNLPDGLSVDTATGAITGTPVLAGTFVATISASNAIGTGSAALTINVATSASAPVITSAAAASGTVGSPFTYQITASNAPASFGATNLPPGLDVNATNGAISGTPTAAGIYAATISASNAGGTGSAPLTITVGVGGTNSLVAGWDFQTTNTGGTAAAAAPSSPSVFQANFGSGAIYLNGSNGASTWITATTGNEVTAYSGTTTNLGAGFSTNTSGAAALTLVAGSGLSANGKSAVFKFSMAGMRGLAVSYATRGSGTSAFTTHTWSYSTDATNWTAFSTNTGRTASTYAALTLPTLTALDGASNAYLRLTVSGATNSSGNNRFDNIQLNASSAAAGPAISAQGTLGPVNTTYGSASPSPTSFVVTGANLTEGIVVAPPAGFEVSQSAGGATGYAASQALAQVAGAASNTVYLRLASSTPAGTYSGSVTCSSAGAPSASIAVPASTVSPKPLEILGLVAEDKYYDGTDAATVSGTPSLDAVETIDLANVGIGGTPSHAFVSAAAGAAIEVVASGYALTGTAATNYSLAQPSLLVADILPRPLTVKANDQTKAFGATLSLGTKQTAFTATGLAPGEAAGTVTLTASGGTAASDPAGTYAITPSDVAAAISIPPSTFRAENYAITYVDGLLNVVEAAQSGSFDAFMQQYPALAGSNALAGADPDGDNLPNLMEYFLGLDPTAAGGAGLGVAQTHGDPPTTSIIYRRAKNLSGVSSAVQWSTNLVSPAWLTNGVVENVIDAGTHEQVTATVTNAPTDAMKFLRLKISQP